MTLLIMAVDNDSFKQKDGIMLSRNNKNATIYTSVLVSIHRIAPIGPIQGSFVYQNLL